MKKQSIAVEVTVDSRLERVWDYYTKPEHIMKWNYASENWCCPKAENDLRVGGRFNSRMEAKDGSFGFDFEGIYDEVIIHKKISYTLSDGRTATTTFENTDAKTRITTIFDPENENTVEQQKAGWQAILNNFKKYCRTVNIKEYIAGFDKQTQERIEQLRQICSKEFPQAEESFKWGNPAYSLKRVLIVYAAYKNHVGFYPTPEVIEEFKEEIEDYKFAKGSVQFPNDKPFPIKLIARMVHARYNNYVRRDAKWK